MTRRSAGSGAACAVRSAAAEAGRSCVEPGWRLPRARIAGGGRSVPRRPPGGRAHMHGAMASCTRDLQFYTPRPHAHAPGPPAPAPARRGRVRGAADAPRGRWTTGGRPAGHAQPHFFVADVAPASARCTLVGCDAWRTQPLMMCPLVVARSWLPVPARAASARPRPPRFAATGFAATGCSS